MTLTETWKYILVCLAAVMLTVALKNYLYFASTRMCPFPGLSD